MGWCRGVHFLINYAYPASRVERAEKSEIKKGPRGAVFEDGFGVIWNKIRYRKAGEVDVVAKVEL